MRKTDKEETPAVEQAQFLAPFLTDSQDTGRGPVIPLMGTSYTYNEKITMKTFKENCSSSSNHTNSTKCRT